jgi:hypothetical protein
MEREGKAEKDYGHWQDETLETCRTEILKWFPDWHTKGRERTGEALRVCCDEMNASEDACMTTTELILNGC